MRLAQPLTVSVKAYLWRKGFLRMNAALFRPPTRICKLERAPSSALLELGDARLAMATPSLAPTALDNALTPGLPKLVFFRRTGVTRNEVVS